MGVHQGLITLLLVFSIFYQTGAQDNWSRRTWQTNLNYNNSRNWNIGRVPCETDRVVLQKSESLALELPASTSLRGLVLPSYTEVILPADGVLRLTGKQNSLLCDGRDAVFKPVLASRWTDGHNWDAWNQATPDLERPPCVSEQAIFPAGTSYKVIMPDFVSLAALQINGHLVDSVDWTLFMASGKGAQQFTTTSQGTPSVHFTGDPCPPTQWCECGNEYLRPHVCSETCALPLCKKPIQPAGFCCPICGAYLMLQIESLRKQELTEHVNSVLSGKGIVWHASKVNLLIQLVLVEEGEYSGEVATVAEELMSSIAKSNKGWTLEEFHKSGHVWYPTTFGQMVGNFFSIMVFVVLVLAGIMVFYSYDWSWLQFSSLEGRPFVFARFENQSGEVIVTSEDSRRQPTESLATQAFDNPMYGATSQEERRVEVTMKEGEVTVENPVYTELNETARTESVEEGMNFTTLQ